jgi:hypothetical protein
MPGPYFMSVGLFNEGNVDVDVLFDAAAAASASA